MRVKVNDNRCVGHGMCYLACPEVFQLSDEDGHVIVANEQVQSAFEDVVVQAQQSCPEQAINIEIAAT